MSQNKKEMDSVLWKFTKLVSEQLRVEKKMGGMLKRSEPGLSSSSHAARTSARVTRASHYVSQGSLE